MTAAIKGVVAYRLGKVRRVDALVSQGRTLSGALRTVGLGVLLAGAPAVAVAALVIWVERGQPETNEALQRHTAEIAQLNRREKAAEAVLGQLDQRAKAAETSLGQLDQRGKAVDTVITQLEALARQARPQLDALRGEAASDRAELSRVRNQVVAIAAAQPTLLTKLEEQQREFLSRIEAVQQRAAADRSDISALRTRMASSSDEQTARVAELQERQKDLSARVDRLLQQASADRSALVQLAGNALDLPRVASVLERRQSDLADQLSKVREEVSAYRSAFGQLEGQVDAIRRASAQRGPQSEETASIAPGAPNEASEADPPSAAEAGAQAEAALVKGAAPRVVLRIARDGSARSAAAKLQTRLRAQGVNIVVASSPPSGVRTNRVLYYYEEDLTSAESIASGLSISRPVQKLFSEDEPLPRPGTIDVAVVQDEGNRKASVEIPFPPSPIVSPPAKRTAVEAMPIGQVVVTPNPLVNEVAAKPVKKLSSKRRVDRRFASRKQLPIWLDKTDGIYFIDQADEMSREYQPVSSLLPAPAGVLTATIDPAADGGRPGPSDARYPRGSKGCIHYKTYDAQTLTYRGYDGVVRACRPL